MTSLTALNTGMGVDGKPSVQPTDINGIVIREYKQPWRATDYRSPGCQNISYINRATELYQIPSDLKNNANVIRNTVLNNSLPFVTSVHKHNVTTFYNGFPSNTRNAA